MSGVDLNTARRIEDMAATELGESDVETSMEDKVAGELYEIK